MVLSAGGLGATLTVYLTTTCHMNALLASILVASFISALTVGGKAYFKTIATKKNYASIYEIEINIIRMKTTISE